MSLTRISSVSVIAFLLGSTAALAQQPHIVAPESVAGAVTQRVDEQDAKRGVVHQALAQPEVAAAAAKLGLDLERANQAVDTLTGEDLDRAATAATQVNESLLGGARTIVISTTAIIIVLLIVLIVVLV